MNDTSVLIVGAGLSGLHVASLLSARGVDCLLLEARTRLGGRALSVTSSESAQPGTYDLGPAWFWPERQPRLRQLVADLGLATSAQHTDGAMLVEPYTLDGAKRFVAQEPARAATRRFRGGVGSLIHAVAETLPKEIIRLGVRVQAIADAGSAGCAVEVAHGTGQREVLHAGKVVFALPPRLIARHIRFDPGLPVQLHSTLLDTPTWVAGQAKAVAIFSRPFWREAGLSGLVSSLVGPLQEIYDASPSEGTGALVGFFGLSPGKRLALGENAVRVLVLAQLVRLFGPFAERPLDFLYKDWAQDPDTAAPDDLEPVGGFPGYGPPKGSENLWEGALVFAGSETAAEHGGYLEGALGSAERAAEQILQRTK